MIVVNEYLEVDPEKKNEQWGDRLVSYNRSYWKNLVDPLVAEKNMNLIMSRYDMEGIKKMFKDPKKLGMEFIPIAVMEKIRNIIIGERVKADVKVNLNAMDPTAESKKEKDKSLLKNRSDGEQLFSMLQTSIGLPEYRLAMDKKVSGKNPFSGNTEMFDQLGLNSQSDFHINYFFQVWHRLTAEMNAQEVVNYFFEINRVRENIDNWCNDIMGKKAIAAQAYVNEITGCIDLKYIAPERVRLIPGKDDDGKDAACIGYEDTVTVGDVIKRIGNSFDWDQHMPYLLTASNYRNKQEFTGLWDGEKVILGQGARGQVVPFDQFLTYKVDIGYMEWKSWDANAYKLGVDFHGNLRQYKRPASYEVPVEEEGNGGYVKETWYTECTYKSFYLSTSTNTQKLFKFGKLFHQVIEGAEDEYSSYSIFFKKEAGPTVAEVALPWFELVQECFTKGRWMVRRAKPKGRSYGYESLIQIANKMIATGDPKSKIKQVIAMFEEGVNEMHTIPTIGGQPLGGGQNPNFDLPNGVDQSVTTFREIIDWCVGNIKSDLGINDIREAYSPNPHDTYKLQAATLEQSRNATDYMERMIDGILRNMAIYTCTLSQDIIRYKSTLPYKFLERAVGQLAINGLEDLEGVALHRYGIFVNSFATYMDRQKLLAETEQAWLKGEVSYETKMLINAIDDYRKAAYILAFEKNRAKAEEQQQAALDHQRAIELEQQKQNTILMKVNLEGKLEKEKETIRGWWYYQSAMAQANSRLNIKALQIDKEPETIANRADANIRVNNAKQQNENQAAIT